MSDGCKSLGKPMLALRERECRWPVSRDGGPALFCATEISGAEWAPGEVGGSYCRFHRLRGVGAGTPAERAAPRVLERLG